MLLMIEREAPPAGPPHDDGRFSTWRCRLARLQDWLWARDEKWAAERGYTVRRSSWGWSVSIRDPRFDRRHACSSCAGIGRQDVGDAECSACGGIGVVTEPERGEQ
jgi:hypothetical protein